MESTEHESAENDCAAHPETLSSISSKSEEADCQGENEKAISKEENCP
jgi:hypothetical protein